MAGEETSTMTKIILKSGARTRNYRFPELDELTPPAKSWRKEWALACQALAWMMARMFGG
jgi:hypothetical protein